MKRICPECNSILGNYDHYFCSTCSSPLPSDLVLKKAGLERKNLFQGYDKSKKDFLNFSIKIDARILLAIIGLTFMLGAFYFLSTQNFFATFSSSREEPKAAIEAPVVEEAVTENSNIEQKDPELLFSDYIPYQTSLYIRIIDEDYKDSFLDYINEEFKTYYTQNEDFVSEEIAFFGIKAGDEIFWNMVLKVSEGFSAPENLESFEKDGYLVLSEYEEIIKESEDAFKQISKNLSKSSKYVLGKSNIPKESENFMIVLDSNFKEDISLLMENEIIPQFYRQMLIDINQTQLDYAFIL